MKPAVTKTRIIMVGRPNTRPPHRPPLLLSQIRSGELQHAKLFLFRKEGKLRIPTRFYLDISITCHEQGKSYYLDINPNLGQFLPHDASISIVKSGQERSKPVWLVRDRRSLGQIGMSLDITPQISRVILFVNTEGSGIVPTKMIATLYNVVK